MDNFVGTPGSLGKKKKTLLEKEIHKMRMEEQPQSLLIYNFFLYWQRNKPQYDMLMVPFVVLLKQSDN